MTRIILSGCNGKMGKTIVELTKSREHVNIVAGIDVISQEQGLFPVFTHPSLCDVDADVLIDFSRPSALEHLVQLGLSQNMGLVIATTGLDDQCHALLHKASEKIPIFLSSNMALGIHLLLDLIQKASTILSPSFDIEIVEKHHSAKEDAPSGTALMIADAINDVLPKPMNYCYERASVRKKRSSNDIGIHSVRGGSIVGEHQVLFAGHHEVIEITHKAYSREIFANGALEAAVFLSKQPKGLYSMKDLVK